MAGRTYPTELYLCTTLIRQDNDGEPVECDAIVYFDARMTSPGYRATWSEPGEGPEYECTFREAALDGPSDDAPGLITAVETDTFRKWFGERKQQEAATECANDNFCGE